MAYILNTFTIKKTSTTQEVVYNLDIFKLIGAEFWKCVYVLLPIDVKAFGFKNK